MIDKTTKFIEEIEIKLPNIFSFEKTIYINSITPITVTCKQHNIDITKVPPEIKRCKGCRLCIKKNKIEVIDKVIIDFINIHGDKYDYSIVEYINNKTYVNIICRRCGVVFQMTPANHKAGRGCSDCAYNHLGKNKRLSCDEFIQKSQLHHKNNLEYIDSDFRGYNYSFNFRCKKHNNFFTQKAKHNLHGTGCKLCLQENIKNKNSLDSNEFFAACNKKHDGYYNYDNSIFKGLHDYFEYICPEHGVVIQKALYHKIGKKCKFCAFKQIGNYTRLTKDEFILKGQSIHGDKYGYDEVLYTNYKTPVKIKCFTHNSFFWQTPEVHLRFHGCPICGKETSKWEIEITDIIKNLGLNPIKDRTILPNHQEIDIFIPELKIGFELNGLYWHSDKDGTKKQYHYNKTVNSKNRGIQLYHFFEDEWIEKRSIVLSFIKNKLGKTEHKIYGRNCEIRLIESRDEYHKFLSNNHLLSSKINSSVRLGLYYNNILVSIMGFKRHEKHQWELNRFCSLIDTVVIGAANKLFNFFIKTFNPESIISFSDNRLSDGHLYEKVLNFKFIDDVPIDYWWINNNFEVREDKRQYRHNRKLKLFPNYEKDKTEHEIMISNDYSYVWDCGKKKYMWEKEKTE